MDAKERLFWSIAFPGLGQLLNKKYLKGFIFIFLEFLINVQSHFNNIILLSFQGDIEKAVKQTNYQWLLFYPCIYFFSMWDAFKDAGGGQESYSFFPFVFCAFTVSIGCFYSSKAKLFGMLLGPVWFPILCVLPGVLIGILLKRMLTNKKVV